MSTREADRNALYTRLVEVLGPEPADTMMTYLPRVPMSELATRSDIERLEERMDRFETRLEKFEGKLEKFDDHLIGFGIQLGQWVRTYTIVTSSLVVAVFIAALGAQALFQ